MSEVRRSRKTRVGGMSAAAAAATSEEGRPSDIQMPKRDASTARPLPPPPPPPLLHCDDGSNAEEATVAVAAATASLRRAPGKRRTRPAGVEVRGRGNPREQPSTLRFDTGARAVPRTDRPPKSMTEWLDAAQMNPSFTGTGWCDAVKSAYDRTAVDRREAFLALLAAGGIPPELVRFADSFQLVEACTTLRVPVVIDLMHLQGGETNAFVSFNEDDRTLRTMTCELPAHPFVQCVKQHLQQSSNVAPYVLFLNGESGKGKTATVHIASKGLSTRVLLVRLTPISPDGLYTAVEDTAGGEESTTVLIEGVAKYVRALCHRECGRQPAETDVVVFFDEVGMYPNMTQALTRSMRSEVTRDRSLPTAVADVLCDGKGGPAINVRVVGAGTGLDAVGVALGSTPNTFQVVTLPPDSTVYDELLKRVQHPALKAYLGATKKDWADVEPRRVAEVVGGNSRAAAIFFDELANATEFLHQNPSKVVRHALFATAVRFKKVNGCRELSPEELLEVFLQAQIFTFAHPEACGAVSADLKSHLLATCGVLVDTATVVNPSASNRGASVVKHPTKKRVTLQWPKGKSRYAMSPAMSAILSLLVLPNPMREMTPGHAEHAVQQIMALAGLMCGARFRDLLVECCHPVVADASTGALPDDEYCAAPLSLEGMMRLLILSPGNRNGLRQAGPVRLFRCAFQISNKTKEESATAAEKRAALKARRAVLLNGPHAPGADVIAFPKEFPMLVQVKRLESDSTGIDAKGEMKKLELTRLGVRNPVKVIIAICRERAAKLKREVLEEHSVEENRWIVQLTKPSALLPVLPAPMKDQCALTATLCSP